MRIVAFSLAFFWALAPAAAQESQELGQMRLYVQQLEEKLRQLTGQNEQLMYELNQLRAQTGQGGAAAAPGQRGAIPQGAQTGGIAAAAPPQDPGAFSAAADDPRVAPDGSDVHSPVDLSEMAGGHAGDPAAAGGGALAPAQPGATQTAALPGAPARAAVSGTARDEYDLAYSYILTGDYGLAEKSFQNWLAAFPDDPQAADARFWLGESLYQQGEYREAANAFLAVYKTAPESAKGPDALLKLGVALSALGEKNAACATLAEVGRKYPQASAALLGRVDEEESRAGC